MEGLTANAINIRLNDVSELGDFAFKGATVNKITQNGGMDIEMGEGCLDGLSTEEFNFIGVVDIASLNAGNGVNIGNISQIKRQVLMFT